MKTIKTKEEMTVTITKEEQEFLKELYRAFGEMLQDIDDDYILNELIVDDFEELAHYGTVTEYFEALGEEENV